jgi:hypothetical protein
VEGGRIRIVDDGSDSEPEPWNPSRSRRVAAATLIGSVFAVALLVLALRSTEDPPSNRLEAVPATTTTTAVAGGDSEPLEPHSLILQWVNHVDDGGDPNLRCVGDAVLDSDNAPLPEGLYILHWTATGQDGLEAESEAPIWITDCEQESNLIADADDITVEISTIDKSGFSNLIYLDRPTEVFIGVDGSGESVTIEGVGTGNALIFRIDVWECADGGVWSDTSCRDTGNSYYSGPRSNNDDAQKYALHISAGPATWVLFNDNPIDPDGADEPGEPNYIDAIFTVGPASP